MYFSPLNINRPVVYLSGGDVKIPLTPAPATTVAGEVMIGHNFWTDWAKESVKASSDPGDGSEFFEVSCAHMWRHCDVVSAKKSFRVAKKNELLPFKNTKSSNQKRWK